MKATETDEQPVVFVIDDDAALRDALKKLFQMVGLRAEVFGAVANFWATNYRTHLRASSSISDCRGRAASSYRPNGRARASRSRLCS